MELKEYIINRFCFNEMRKRKGGLAGLAILEQYATSLYFAPGKKLAVHHRGWVLRGRDVNRADPDGDSFRSRQS